MLHLYLISKIELKLVGSMKLPQAFEGSVPGMRIAGCSKLVFMILLLLYTNTEFLLACSMHPLVLTKFFLCPTTIIGNSSNFL